MTYLGCRMVSVRIPSEPWRDKIEPYGPLTLSEGVSEWVPMSARLVIGVPDSGFGGLGSLD